MKLWDELKRRQVVRVALVYAATAFALTPQSAPTETVAHAAVGSRTVIVAGVLVVLGIGLGAGWFLKPAAPTSATTTAPEKSVAVLPFLALSSGADDEYFADGLTEEILNSLAALPELLVTARTSSFHFKGRDLPVPEVAKTLGVRHIVEGSVRRSNQRLRITAQLIRAADGFHLWSQTYERDESDVFAVQQDIAHSVAAALDLVLDEEKLRLMEQAGVRDVEAFIAFQKGYQLYNDAHADLPNRNAILERANAHFEQAFTRVPAFMPAHLFHADLFIHRLLDAARDLEGHRLSAERLAEERRTLDERLRAAAVAARTPAHRAVVDYTRALASSDWRPLLPAVDLVFTSKSCVPLLYLYLAVLFGREREGREMLERAAACNPLDADVLTSLAAALVWEGRARDALRVTDELEQRIGGHHWFDQERLLAQLALGDFSGARATVASPALSAPERDEWVVALAAAEGRLADARAAATDWFRRHGSDDARTLRFAGWLGQRDSANAVAARIDARELGPFALTHATELCRCGSPFDLAATPRLRARLEEARAPWPPRTLIRFPQKNW